MKKVSVILTSYNAEKTIATTIHSILNQDRINRDFELELIVVDDCSDDTTRDIVKKFDVVLLKTDHNSGGPNKGRNIGLKHATGDYFCIADHDDVWEKNMIISVLPYLEKAPIVSTGYTVIDHMHDKHMVRVGDTNKNFLYFPKNKTFTDLMLRSLKKQNVYMGSLFFTEKLKSTFFEEHFGMIDFDWVLRLFHNNDSIEVCKSLYNRHVWKDNLSLNETYRKKDFYYSLMFIESYEDQYPSLVRKAYKRVHGSRARYYYVTGNMKKARFYFLKSEWGIKSFLYYVTSFVGSGLVKKHFHIFG
jgi:glycosyltransferase involved in cell wall biosynthesis